MPLWDKDCPTKMSRQLIHVTDLDRLLPIATKVRDIAHPTAISYSRKVFVPLLIYAVMCATTARLLKFQES